MNETPAGAGASPSTKGIATTRAYVGAPRRTPIDVVLAALEAHGCDPAPEGERGWSARCPVNPDHRLTFTEGDDGRVTIGFCPGGCDPEEEILPALGLTLADLTPAPTKFRGRVRCRIVRGATPVDIPWEEISAEHQATITRRLLELELGDDPATWWRAMGGTHQREWLAGEEHPRPDMASWEIDHARAEAGADDETAEAFEELSPLRLRTLAELYAEDDAAGEPRYLIRPLWGAGDHGVIGGSDKIGKSLLEADAAVSVASGTPWLGIFPVETSGPVVMYAGEGGRRKLVRRLRAICRARGVDGAALPIEICLQVPHLTNKAAMEIVAGDVARVRPVLIIIDPLYLAARGAKGSDLYEMGMHLEAAQVIAQRSGSALMVVHHWNQTGSGTGSIRFSGAGPSAWGRVLVSAAVRSRRTDPETGRTSVTLDLAIQGDEVADQTVRVRRDVWADDPETLSSPLHYEVARLEVEEPVDPRTGGLRPSARRVFRVLEAAAIPITVQEIGDRLAVDDTGSAPLKKNTIQKALKELDEADLVDADEPGRGKPGQWWASAPESAPRNGD